MYDTKQLSVSLTPGGAHFARVDLEAWVQNELLSPDTLTGEVPRSDVECGLQVPAMTSLTVRVVRVTQHCERNEGVYKEGRMTLFYLMDCCRFSDIADTPISSC